MTLIINQMKKIRLKKMEINHQICKILLARVSKLTMIVMMNAAMMLAKNRVTI